MFQPGELAMPNQTAEDAARFSMAQCTICHIFGRASVPTATLALI